MKNFKVTNKRENARVECIFHTRISSILKKRSLNQSTLSVDTTSVSLERIVLLTQAHTYMHIAEMGNGCSECSFEIRVGNCARE